MMDPILETENNQPVQPEAEPRPQPVQPEAVVPPQPAEPAYSGTVPPQGWQQSPWQYPPVYWQPPQPVKVPKPKKESTGRAKKVFSCLGITVAAVALIAVSCFVTNLLVAGHWENQVDELSEKYEARYQALDQAADNRIDVLGQELEALKAQLQAQNSGSETPDKPEDAMLPEEVYARNVDAVVAVTSQVVSNSYFGPSESVSSGSGFIISADGYVVTNYHVVQGGTALYVTTHSGKEYEAELIGYDANNDVSVLKVDGEDLPYARIGSSDELQVGQRVAAIGNPLGELTATMTVGYVSAKDRMVTTDGTAMNMIQTDAAINSGNSGGPMFDMYGNVVGITTAKYSGTSTSGATIEGIGFAIPIDDVWSIITDLRDYGYVKGAYLGVHIREFDSTVAQTYGLPAGVYVESTMDGLCAQKAGIQSGDIIINLGGYEVASVSDLTRALRKFEAGQTTTITVFRNGGKVHLEITLDERPKEEQQTAEQEGPETIMPESGGYDDFFEYFFGG